MILLFISFIAGVLTILAPCTLPLLPVIIGSSLSANDGTQKPNMKKALVIAGSLGASVVLFTLLLKVGTLFIHIPVEAWSVISGLIIIAFGLVSLFPELWDKIPLVQKMNTSSNRLLGKGYLKKSTVGDILIGASLGPVFSTCSPTYFIILATVLPQSFLLGFVYLIAYALGLSGVLLLVAFIGQRVVSSISGLSDPHGPFKKILGVLFVIVGILVIFGVDKAGERYLLNSGFGDITKVEQKLLKFNDKSDSAFAGTSGDEGVLLGNSKNTLGSYEVDGDAVPVRPAAEITKPSGFVNTDGRPITIGEFKGKKVVLLDIWTYSCINCQRTIPYIVAWNKKYKDAGLEIIGLHTPEFAFEKIQKNVENAAKDFGITYPIVLDNDYATWNAFGNNYWPRKYLINADGNIVYDHTGEGDYEKTERQIQKALVDLKKETGSNVVIPMDIVRLNADGKAQASKVNSPETYFGAKRNEYLANGVQGKIGIQIFVLPGMKGESINDSSASSGIAGSGAGHSCSPSTQCSYDEDQIQKNALYLGGTWDIQAESAKAVAPTNGSNIAGASSGTASGISHKIVFKYDSKDVYMVASSPLPDGTVLTLKKDGVAAGTVTVSNNKLYTLIKGNDYGEHILEIDIPDAGFEAFTFTFG